LLNQTNFYCSTYKYEGKVCTFTNQGDANKLPALTFSLSESGPILKIPLGTLLTFSRDYGYNLCMRNTDTSSRYDDARIIFGNLVLQSLYAVFNMDDMRVGLTNKFKTNENDSFCANKSNCEPKQIYDAQHNQCLNPKCSEYFFQEVDPKTKSCRLSFTFELIVVIVFIILGITEVIGHEFYIKTSLHVEGNFAVISELNAT